MRKERKVRRERSDKGKARKFAIEKKGKLSVSVDKDNYFYVKRLAQLMGGDGNESRVVNRMITVMRLNNPREVDFLVRQKRLEIEYLLHESEKERLQQEG